MSEIGKEFKGGKAIFTIPGDLDMDKLAIHFNGLGKKEYEVGAVVSEEPAVDKSARTFTFTLVDEGKITLFNTTLEAFLFSKKMSIGR